MSRQLHAEAEWTRTVDAAALGGELGGAGGAGKRWMRDWTGGRGWARRRMVPMRAGAGGGWDLAPQGGSAGGGGAAPGDGDGDGTPASVTSALSYAPAPTRRAPTRFSLDTPAARRVRLVRGVGRGVSDQYGGRGGGGGGDTPAARRAGAFAASGAALGGRGNGREGVVGV